MCVKRIGLKGCWYHKRIGKWQAGIQKNNNNTHLGSFDTEVQAHMAYMKAAKQLFGEFARAA